MIIDSSTSLGAMLYGCERAARLRRATAATARAARAAPTSPAPAAPVDAPAALAQWPLWHEAPTATQLKYRAAAAHLGQRFRTAITGKRFDLLDRAEAKSVLDACGVGAEDPDTCIEVFIDACVTLLD